MDDREQFINTTQALNELLSQNIIPVINENDIVATEELKFGDNDRLSAIVSIIVNASKLLIITNKEGLYDFNPDKNSDAKVIDFIQYDSSQLTDLIPISGQGEGQGGFSTKIMAAQIAGFSGIPTQIISWSEENITKANKWGTSRDFDFRIGEQNKIKKIMDCVWYETSSKSDHR